MKKKETSKGLMIVGSMRSAGVTTYMRLGRLVTRTSSSLERRSNTLPQFIQRQKMRHTMALWKSLKCCKPMFTEHQTPYLNFSSLANRLPAVYVPQHLSDLSFLMPGIPMSDGTLPVVSEQLGEVDGMPALLTDLKADAWKDRTALWLYTAEQQDGDSPCVRFSKREVPWQEMTLADGRYVLKGEAFADPMKGWALVLVRGGRCSTQAIVTRCTLYEQYTTDEALQTAAKSYGGLTRAII
ncbi:MAG: hypothetical protein II822_08185 [Prevotella sp.]|nr:hypothetical protein [Prevotella sp.]